MELVTIIDTSLKLLLGLFIFLCSFEINLLADRLKLQSTRLLYRLRNALGVYCVIIIGTVFLGLILKLTFNLSLFAAIFFWCGSWLLVFRRTRKRVEQLNLSGPEFPGMEKSLPERIDGLWRSILVTQEKLKNLNSLR